MNSDLQLIGTEEESSSNAIQPFTPNIPPMHHPLPGFLVAEGSRIVALGPLQVLVNLWYLILTICWKIKGSTKLSSAQCPGQRPRLPTLLNPGAAAGSCSLWVLAPRELGFVLSESYPQRFPLH